MEWVTKAEFRRLSKWSQSYVDTLLRDGRLRKRKKGGKIQIAMDSDATSLLGKARGAGRRAGGSAYARWLKEKTEGEKIANKMRQLRLDGERGRHRELAEAVIVHDVSIVKNRLLALGSKLAPRLATMGGDPWRIQALLQEEHRQLLEDSVNLITKIGREMFARILEQDDPGLAEYYCRVEGPLGNDPEAKEPMGITAEQKAKFIAGILAAVKGGMSEWPQAFRENGLDEERIGWVAEFSKKYPAELEAALNLVDAELFAQPQRALRAAVEILRANAKPPNGHA